MSLGKRITFGVMASWSNRAVAVILNLIFIPFLFRYMGQEELGLWFLLGQSGAFLGLMDMGAAPTLIRHIAFSVTSGSDREALGDLIAVARTVYRFLAIAVFIIAWLCGVLFIGLLEFEQINRETALLAWSILCFGHGLNVWAGVWPCIMQGAGHPGASLIIGMAINVFVVAGQVSAILLGGGIVELAVFTVIGALVTRYCMAWFIQVNIPEIAFLKGKWRPDLFRKLVKPAMLAWFTVLGGFLVLKTDQYFIAAFKGTELIPAYHAAYQLVSNLYVLAVSLAGASGVYISYLWQNRNHIHLQKIVIRNMQCGLSIMICGVACLYLVGADILNLWLGAGNFVGNNILIVFCFALLLQTQHEMLMTFSRATENEVYARSAIAAGVLNICFTLLLIQYFDLLGVALGTLLAQLLTNNWYGLHKGLYRLGIPYRRYLYEVVAPVILIGFLSLTFGYGILNIVNSSNLLALKILPVVLACGSILAGALWYFIYSERLKYSGEYLSKGLIE